MKGVDDKAEIMITDLKVNVGCSIDREIKYKIF